MQHFGTIVIFATALTLATTTCTAYVSLSLPFCGDVPHSDGTIELVCASMQKAGPSPVIMDGQVSYVGDYAVDYLYTEQHDGIRFHVEWTDPADRRCTASINDLECRTCFRQVSETTGDDEIKVDCRNIPDGRRTEEFESIAMNAMFFPLDSN